MNSTSPGKGISACPARENALPWDHDDVDDTDLANERTMLANERTFLAYVRTALAVIAGALAVVGYVSNLTVALVGGIGLLVIGFVTLIGGYLRWKQTQHAIVQNIPLMHTTLPTVITVVLSATALLTLVTLLVTR